MCVRTFSLIGHRPPDCVCRPIAHHRRCGPGLFEGVVFHMDRPHRRLPGQPGCRFQERGLQG